MSSVNPSHGTRKKLSFADEIDSTLERIRLNPGLYPIMTDNIRRIQVDRFPFFVFYTMEQDTLVILRIFHNKRAPVQW